MIRHSGLPFRPFRRAAALFAALVFLLAPLSGLCLESPVQTVRVGWYALDGFQEMDENGTPSGYSYDILAALRRYANIDYEYVGYGKTREELEQMLLDGEIDTVATVRPRDTRTGAVEYSMPVGEGTNCLTVRAGDARFSTESLAALDGLRIGLVLDTSAANDLAEFAETNGFTYVTVAYMTSDSLKSALRSGEIDAAVDSALRIGTDEKALAEFGTVHYYLTFLKGSGLTATINAAVAQLDAAESNWREDLFYENVRARRSVAAGFTKAEKAYIRAHSAGGKKVVVAVDRSWAPFSYLEKGEYCGILPDYWRLIAAMTGMDYEFYDGGSDIFDESGLLSGKADIYFGWCFGTAVSERGGYLESSPFMEVSACLITLSGTTAVRTVGLSAVNARLNSVYTPAEGQTTVTYENAEALIDALKAGKVNAALLYDYEGDRILNRNRVGALVRTLVPDISLPLCAITPLAGDHTLTGIVSKCIASITDTQRNTLVSQNLSADTQHLTVWETLLLHPRMTVCTASVLLLLAAAFVFTLIRSRKQLRGRMAEINGLNDALTVSNAGLELRRLELDEAFRKARAAEETVSRMHEALGSAAWQIDYNEAGDAAACHWSDGMRRMLGYENADDFPDTIETFLACVHPDDVPQLLRQTNAFLMDLSGRPNVLTCGYRVRTKGGSIRIFRINAQITRRADGLPSTVYGVIQDVTELENAQAEQRAALESAEAIYRTLGTGTWKIVVSADGNVLSCTWSAQFRKLLGYSESVFTDDFGALIAIIHPDDRQRTFAAINPAFTYGGRVGDVNLRLKTANEGYRWFRITGLLAKRGDGTSVLHGVLLRVNEIDALTGLYNREAFSTYAGEMVAANPGTAFTVVISDVTDFKQINDIYGRETADRLLRYLAERYERFLSGRKHVLARYGSDRFIVLFDAMDIPDAVVFGDLSRELTKDAPIPNLSLKYGAYEDIDRTLPIERCCDRAVSALNSVKDVYGRTVGRYNGPLATRHRLERRMMSEFPGAIANHRFEVWFQPKFAPETGRVNGAEALVRWCKDDGTLVFPGDFVPFFEQCGRITELDLYMFDRTCAFLAERHAARLENVPISVNISRATLLSANAPEKYKAIAAKHGVPLALVPIEITESAALGTAQITARAKELKESGFGLHMDDFGSGYSSLSSLGQLPFDVIKLDKGLTDTVGTAEGELILRHAVEIIHALGHTVVAEGVETEAQAAFFRLLRCESLQGFYYSKPIPRAAFEALLG